MKNLKIAFIGGGNMATSLISGLLADGYHAKQIWVSEPNVEKRAYLQAALGIHVVSQNAECLEADVLVFAVKPQVAQQVISEIAAPFQANRPLVISIMTGIKITHFEEYLGKTAIVRTMPNTPALVRAGATGLFANEQVSPEQKNCAESILRAVGITVWLEKESDLDLVTALSGSGPAYFLYVMEALQQAAIGMGMTTETARLLTLQTALGTARLAMESNDLDVTELRQRVTSPQGTTERAVNVLKEANILGIFESAVQAAFKRAEELGENPF